MNGALSDALTLARKLGAVPFQIKGPDLPIAAAGFVKEYGITRIVVGRSRRSWLQRLLSATSPLDRLLRAVPGVDVVVDTTSPVREQLQ